MEIITAIGFVILACAINPPNWWQIILYILFVLLSIAVGSLGVTNSMFKMRENIRKETDRKAGRKIK